LTVKSQEKDIVLSKEDASKFFSVENDLDSDDDKQEQVTSADATAAMAKSLIKNKLKEVSLNIASAVSKQIFPTAA